MEEYIVPPSGEWSGFYLQNGEKNYFTMCLHFSSSSNGLHGQCTDNEVLLHNCNFILLSQLILNALGQVK